MHVPRRLKPLLLAFLLCAAWIGSPATAGAQDAGDQQYQDPLTSTTKTATATATTSRPAPKVSQIPQLSPTPGTTTTPPPTTVPTTPTTSSTPARPAASTLPNTGVDGRILAAFGLGLLLCGIGLRLRTARERF